MPLSFPSSPTVGQTYTANGRAWSWTGVTWDLVAASGGGGDGSDALLRSLFVPAAPNSVTATGGNAQAVVSWTAPTGVIAQAPITDYIVQYSSDSGTTWTTFADGATTSTTATVTGLTTGVGYVFRVAAVNAIGQGPYSAESAAATPVAGDPHIASVDLLLRLNGTTSDEFGAIVTVAGAPAYAEGRFGQSMTNATVSAPTSNYGSSAFALEGWFKVQPGALLAPDSYSMYTAYQSILFGLGNGIEATTQDGSHLFRGIQVQRISSGYSGTPLGITYKGDGGLGGYALAGPSNGFAIDDSQWHHVAMVRSADDSIRLYIDGSLAVSSSLNANAGSLSSSPQVFLTKNPAVLVDELRLTVGTDRGFTGATIEVPAAQFNGPLAIAPAAPAAPAATAGEGLATLSWSAPARNGSAAPTDYAIQYSTNGGSTWSDFADLVSAATSATVTGLAAVSHIFRVAAINSNGQGSWSSPSAAVTVQAILPGAVLSLTAFPGDGNVTLTWGAPAANGSGPVTSYAIEWNDGFDWLTLAERSGDYFSYEHLSLANEVQYSYRVRAVSAAGAGPWATVGPVTPSASGSVTITSQPQNNYSALFSDTAYFQVGATQAPYGVASYKWQYNGYDPNTYEYGWIDFPVSGPGGQNIGGVQADLLSLTPSTVAANGLGLDMYQVDVRVRCIVTSSLDASVMVTSAEARWVNFAQVNPQNYGLFWYGSSGSYPSGATQLNNGEYATSFASVMADEDMIVEYSDYYSYMDTSWISGTIVTVKLERSLDLGSSWQDTGISRDHAYLGFVDTFQFRDPDPISGGGTRAYRLAIVPKWPLTVTNGSSSFSRPQPPAVRYFGYSLIAWP